MTKLTKAQQHVLDRMSNSWELGISHSFGMRCWLQQGGIGEGGQSEDIRYSTLKVLFRKGFIKQAGKKGAAMTFQLA